MFVVGGYARAYTLVAEHGLVVRKTKDIWCVVLRDPKDHVATEAAHHSRY
jgi:hypothetical protein